MNSTNLVGRLTKDIELRYLDTGKAVGNGNIAVNRPFKNKDGEQEADFILFNVWGKQAENLAQYMKKGDRIGITGRIQTRNYENKEGQRVYVTEVVAEQVSFLESKGNNQKTDNNTSNQTNQKQGQQKQSQTNESQGEPVEVSEDDLPF